MGLGAQVPHGPQRTTLLRGRCSVRHCLSPRSPASVEFGWPADLNTPWHSGCSTSGLLGASHHSIGRLHRSDALTFTASLMSCTTLTSERSLYPDGIDTPLTPLSCSGRETAHNHVRVRSADLCHRSRSLNSYPRRRSSRWMNHHGVFWRKDYRAQFRGHAGGARYNLRVGRSHPPFRSLNVATVLSLDEDVGNSVPVVNVSSGQTGSLCSVGGLAIEIIQFQTDVGRSFGSSSNPAAMADSKGRRCSLRWACMSMRVSPARSP